MHPSPLFPSSRQMIAVPRPEVRKNIGLILVSCALPSIERSPKGAFESQPQCRSNAIQHITRGLVIVAHASISDQARSDGDPKPEKYAGHKLRKGLAVWSSARAGEGHQDAKEGPQRRTGPACIAPGGERNHGARSLPR